MEISRRKEMSKWEGESLKTRIMFKTDKERDKKEFFVRGMVKCPVT
jgi:hypothetical protein